MSQDQLDQIRSIIRDAMSHNRVQRSEGLRLLDELDDILGCDENGELP